MNVFIGTVEDLSSEGLGVVKHPDGMTFFVNGAWPGDAGELEIISKEKRYGFAKFKNQTEWSKDRIPSPCPHLGFEPGKCGGCPWMIASYDKQLFYKDKYLKMLFQKFRYEANLEPIHGSERVFGFRNRAQFKTNGKQIGYVSPKSRVLAPIEDCVILNEPVRNILKSVRARLPNKEWEPPGRYLWNFLEVDEDMTFEEIELNKRRPFKQANREANTYMREWVQEKIKNISKHDLVLELFCGSGNFTEVLSAHFDSIKACELPGSATAKLQAMNLPGVEVVEANIFAQINWPELFEKIKDTKILLLDPPREGFKDLEAFITKLPRLEKILYISCDPYSFAMNIKPLINSGWNIGDVQPVDQFPHTPHMELMAILERKSLS